MFRELPPTPESRRLTTRLMRGIVAAAVGVTMVCSSVMPGWADSLDDQQDRLHKEIAAQAVAVDEAHSARSAAVDAATAARSRLADAKAALAKAESELDQAEELDRKRAEELAAAEKKFEQAKADVAAAQAALDSTNSRLNEEILVTTQQNSGLLNLALLFTDLDASNLNQRAQMASTLFDSSQLQLDQLEMRRLQLEDAQAAADAAEKAATAARETAATQLEASQDSAERAAALKVEVDRLSKEADEAAAAANAEVVAEEKRQSELEAENAAVEKRIQDRIAKAAADKAAADKAAALAAAAKPAPSRPTSTSGSSSSGSGAQSSSSATFMLPVSGRMTSKYGMRLHPVLGYWKLHDGTDFAAACGAPMWAAADGVVTDRYFNSGYGNRLMIDHQVGSMTVTTGYNHAQRYIVNVGQTVKKGQVIGYVGTTGYSTGCHLHLMTWENGKLVNPMAKWFA